MRIALLDNTTLEIYDIENKKNLYLSDLLIEWVSMDIKDFEDIMNIIDKSDRGVILIENVDNLTKEFGVYFAQLIKKSFLRKYGMPSVEKSILHRYKNIPPEAFDVYSTSLFLQYFHDDLVPFINELKNVVVNNKLPENIDKFNSLVKYSFFRYEDTLYDSFEFEYFEDFLFFATTKMLQSKIVIKVCANCGKLFIPINRSDEIYCNRVNQGNRTCKQVGYENKDEYIKSYRTAYKTKNALKNRNINNNPHAEDDFKKWVYAAKLKLEEAQGGGITLEEFKEWLKQ